MLAKILRTNTVDHLGFDVTLQSLCVTLEKVSFTGVIRTNQKYSNTSGLALAIESNSRIWTFQCKDSENFQIIEGEIATKELAPDVTFFFTLNNISHLWLHLKLDLQQLDNVGQWSSYFSGYADLLGKLNLGGIAKQILNTAEVINAVSPSGRFSTFCEYVRSIDFVVRLAQLRTDGRFPAIVSDEDGVIIASRLVADWNVLLVQDSGQRLFIFQGVTSCDAVFIPGLNKLIIVCHITQEQILRCLRELCHTPEFFQLVRPRSFIGYLVGHARPYHSNYDSLLALQHIREKGELDPKDALFSKCDEAFIDLGAGLGLSQKHQCKTKESINKITDTQKGFVLKIGSWYYYNQEPDPRSLILARHVDQSLRQFANTNSVLAESGALDFMEECEPLLWVGVTGQKRCWLEQVEGTAQILNTLYEYYPRLGIIFDGWTPPLFSSKYHRMEARKDDKVIQKIIKKLPFRKHSRRFGIVAGLPMLEKIGAGNSVDLFMANYTTGSMNIARICQKPGIGHMSRKMAMHKSQHIHHQTKEIDLLLVKDQDDYNTPTGYINYSIPWQAVYNQLINILAELKIEPSKPLKPLDIPSNSQ